MSSSTDYPSRSSEAEEAAKQQQMPGSWNPAGPTQLPSEMIGTSSTQAPAAQSPSPPFNGSDFWNFSDFNWDGGAAIDVPVDWENFNRVPSGSSIIDVNSVIDESGRSFHGYKEGKYFLPNDAPEQDRLDLQHAALLKLLDGKLYMAPIKDPEHVLDVATGTGIWALEFAEKHPDAQVIGIDLSEIQPKWRMPNCTFFLEDAEEEWLFGNSDRPIQFDYVHLRMVFTCFERPREIIRQAYKNLKPGGWIEYLDGCWDIAAMDKNLPGSALEKWYQAVKHFMESNGRDFRVMYHYAPWLRAEGFVDVVEHRFLVPCNPWPRNPRLKDIGQFMMANIHVGLRGAGWKALKSKGYSNPEIEQIIMDAKREITSSEYRIYVPFTVVYGRKPFENEVNDSKSTSGAGGKVED